MGLGAGEGALGPGGGNTDRGSLLSQSRVRCAVSAGLLTRAGSAAVRQCGTLGGFKGPAPRRRPPSLGHPWGRARAARAGCGAGRDGTARGQSRKAQGRGRGRGRPRGRGCAGEPRHPGAQVLRRRPALRAGRAAVKGDGGGGATGRAAAPRQHGHQGCLRLRAAARGRAAWGAAEGMRRAGARLRGGWAGVRQGPQLEHGRGETEVWARPGAGIQQQQKRPGCHIRGRGGGRGGGGGTAAPALLPRRPSVRWKRQGWAPQRAGAGGSRGAWPGGGALPGAGARARAVRRRGARAGPRGADGTAPGAPVR
jgi:hypothetical protein